MADNEDTDPQMSLHRYGLRIGRWHITWWDSWAKRPCWEIAREGEGR
jgi:hypothetical protein